MFRGKIARQAEVAEQADALRSGRSELYAHVGSTPTFGIRFPGIMVLVPVEFFGDFSINPCGHSTCINQEAEVRWNYEAHLAWLEIFTDRNRSGCINLAGDGF